MHPLLRPSKGILLEPSDPNPYETPKSSIKQESQQFQRPNAVDWFFAICLGLLAVTLVFPTTCFGSAFIFLTFVDLHSQSTLAAIFAWLLFAACIGLTLAAAIWVGRLYIRAVKKAQANRAKEIARTKKKIKTP